MERVHRPKISANRVEQARPLSVRSLHLSSASRPADGPHSCDGQCCPWFPTHCREWQRLLASSFLGPCDWPTFHTLSDFPLFSHVSQRPLGLLPWAPGVHSCPLDSSEVPLGPQLLQRTIFTDFPSSSWGSLTCWLRAISCCQRWWDWRRISCRSSPLHIWVTGFYRCARDRPEGRRLKWDTQPLALLELTWSSTAFPQVLPREGRVNLGGAWKGKGSSDISAHLSAQPRKPSHGSPQPARQGQTGARSALAGGPRSLDSKWEQSPVDGQPVLRSKSFS